MVTCPTCVSYACTWASVPAANQTKHTLIKLRGRPMWWWCRHADHSGEGRRDHLGTFFLAPANPSHPARLPPALHFVNIRTAASLGRDKDSVRDFGKRWPLNGAEKSTFEELLRNELARHFRGTQGSTIAAIGTTRTFSRKKRITRTTRREPRSLSETRVANKPFDSKFAPDIAAELRRSFR